MGGELASLAGMSLKKLPDGKLGAVSLLRVTDSAKAYILAALNCRCLAVASDNFAARSLERRIASWGVKTRFIPYRDDMLISRKGASQSNMFERLVSLSALANGENSIFVTSAEALLQQFPSLDLIRKYSVTVKTADVVPPTELADKFALAGYRRQEMISDIGDFALRGDILDVYSLSGSAYRINFFDELVEDIKIIDPESMLSIGSENEVTFAPVSDVLATPEAFRRAVSELSKRQTMRNAAQTISKLKEGACDPSAVFALPFLEDCMQPLLSYFEDGEPTVIAFDEPKVIKDKLGLLYKEFEGRIKALEGTEILPEHKRVYINLNEFDRLILKARKLSLSGLNISNPLFEPKTIMSPKFRAVTKYYLDPDSLAKDLESFSLNGMKTLFAAGNSERAKSVVESLRELGFFGEFSADGESGSPIVVSALGIECGLIAPESKAVVIGVSECVGKMHKQTVSLHKKEFNPIKAGDYVVHRVHGVGLCEGTTRMKTGEFEREYIVIKYKDGDTLYVATDQMDQLQKFIGEENPPLNKLGGKDFEREKEKVRKSVRKMALNLADIYAKREKEKGFKYSPDSTWQKSFEDAFEYDETPDQLSAISDIKRDMEQGRIMDRLIVGDVGFGKTEVAFRAMFKTALDGKQSALLAPTTILARQHWENLAKRLEPFGIKCGLLTRMQTAKENSQLIADIKDGTVSMVVATHKVLSKQVEFFDLGLLVLDEEQRFGVEHKETLKSRYPLVNVLTLSATPIPRTLNMSLSGIRDISMLETAPQGRLPVQTYVTSYSDELCRDAVSREIARGGQTFICLNSIERLKPFAENLRGLCPEARIITAHGQLPSGELDERMRAFYDKEYDVLVATTIIENGIDLPDANTLIVIDSGNFGLAQLYQLRGRVGRRGALAHAYFTVPENGSINGDAEKRLKTLLDNTEIGSGFKIALADLSIRGAGTLLGAEQSGHIEKVGYEMYLELLDEAINEIKTGVIAKPAREVEMRVDISAYISEGYVSQRDKIRVYKQISSVKTIKDRDDLLAMLAEVYGPVSAPLKNLVNISLLKSMAEKFGASRITVNRGGATVAFYDSDAFSSEALMNAVADMSERVSLASTIPPSLIFDVKSLSAEQKLDLMIEFFGDAILHL